MTDALRSAAERAGLVDFDLLKIVRPGLAPDEAVAELRSRLPGAFRPDVRNMNRADYVEAVERMLSDARLSGNAQRAQHIQTEAAKPDVRELSRDEYRKRRAEYLGGLR